MRALLDTQILLRLSLAPQRLPATVRAILEDGRNALYFSVVSIWEIAVKRALNRPDFTVEPEALRAGLLADTYIEIALASSHCLPVRYMPLIHKDPFDRLLLAQASVERLTFVTTDKVLAKYSGDVMLV